MQAETIIEVALDTHGRSRAERIRCEAPLLVRESRDDQDELVLWLVNGAAGPLGGDRLSFVLAVGEGATVVVRSVAAAMIHPGPHGGTSRSTTRLEIHDRATLDWRPEPMVSVVGSNHDALTTVEIADGATARITETVSLGRHAEESGRLSLGQRALVGGHPVLDHRTEFAPGVLLGPGAHGTGRAFRSTLFLGPGAPHDTRTSVRPDGFDGVLVLAPGCALGVARAAEIDRLPPL